MAKVWRNCIGFVASTFCCKTKNHRGSQESRYVTFSDEELPTSSGQSEKQALFTAIANRNFADVQDILATILTISPDHADVTVNEFRDEEGYTALHRIITVADDWEQSADAVKLLLEKGCDPNTPTDDNLERAALQLVVCNERFSPRSDAILRHLLEHDGISVDSCDKYGNSALKLAVEKGHSGVVKILISKKADVNKTDNCRNTPLYCAAKKNHLKEACLLLESKADSTHQNKDYETALHAAVCSKHPKMVALLLTSGNQEAINKENKSGDTPLAVAKMKEPDPNVKKIIEMLTNPDTVRPPCLEEEESDVKAGYSDVPSQVQQHRCLCLAVVPQGTGQPSTTIEYHTNVYGGGIAAIGPHSTANINGHLSPVTGCPGLPNDDNYGEDRIKRLLPVESLVHVGSANSSDQMESSPHQCQKENQGKTTTQSEFHVHVKNSSGTTVVGDNSFVTVSPTQEELPGAFGNTVPNVDQGTVGDHKTDSTRKTDGQLTGVPKIARVALKK